MVENETPNILDGFDAWRDMSGQEFQKISSQFARCYAAQIWPENDDPIDDFKRMLRLALIWRDSKGLDPAFNYPEPNKTKNAGTSYERMLLHFSAILHMAAPILPICKWEILLQDLLAERYGETKVRLKKNPGKQKKSAAKGMTIKEIQEKLSVSRTYAYKLYREVNKTVKK